MIKSVEVKSEARDLGLKSKVGNNAETGFGD